MFVCTGKGLPDNEHVSLLRIRDFDIEDIGRYQCEIHCQKRDSSFKHSYYADVCLQTDNDKHGNIIGNSFFLLFSRIYQILKILYLYAVLIFQQSVALRSQNAFPLFGMVFVILPVIMNKTCMMVLIVQKK